MNLEFQSFCNLESFKATPSKGHKRLNTAIKALAVLAIISGAYFLGAAIAPQPASQAHRQMTKKVTFRVYVANGPRNNLRQNNLSGTLGHGDRIKIKLYNSWTPKRLNAELTNDSGANTNDYKTFSTINGGQLNLIRQVKLKQGSGRIRVCYKGSNLRCPEKYRSSKCWTADISNVSLDIGKEEGIIKIYIRANQENCHVRILALDS